MEEAKTASTLRGLSSLDEVRFSEEGSSRPRVEVWFDDWADWVQSHEGGRQHMFYCTEGMTASPFCALGVH
jgi:hypothetical protein